MKISKIILIIGLTLLNLSVFSFLSALNQNAKIISESIATIPNNVVYINAATTSYPDTDSFVSRSSDFPDAKTNYEKLDQIKLLSNVENVEFLNITPSQTETVYSKIENHKSIPLIQIQAQAIRTDQLDQVELISGDYPYAKNQVIISSAVVDHYGHDYMQVVGQTVSGYEISGVYKDNSKYQTTNYGGSKLIVNPVYQLDSNVGSNSSYFFTTDDGTELPVQYIKITFDNDDTASNIKLLEDKLIIHDSISNLSTPSQIMSSNTATMITISTTVVIDVVVLLILFYFRK